MNDNFHVIFLPGYLSKPINIIFKKYFKEQINFLKANNISYSFPKIHTEKTIEYNADIIAKEILKYEKVKVITHSKGGVDFLHTLIKYPSIRSHIIQATCMQAPFRGTLMANLLTNNMGLKFVSKVINFIFRGDYEALKELSITSRNKYFIEYENEINEVLNTVNLNTIGSFKQKSDQKKFDSILFFFRNYMEKKGKKNDGVVPVESTLIKEDIHIVIEGVDHADLVVNRFTNKKINRYKLTNSLLTGDFSPYNGKKLIRNENENGPIFIESSSMGS